MNTICDMRSRDAGVWRGAGRERLAEECRAAYLMRDDRTHWAQAPKPAFSEAGRYAASRKGA